MAYRVIKLMDLYCSRWLLISILLTLALMLACIPQGNARVLLASSALEPNQVTVADENKNTTFSATDDHALRSKSTTPLEKITRRVRRDSSDTAGSGSCRKHYQQVSKTTLQMILHRELRGRAIVFPAIVKLPYCIGSCAKVTLSNYHQLVRDANHGNRDNSEAAAVCQAEGESMMTWIVAGPEPVSDDGISRYGYEVLKLPLEITKCSCYPRY